MMMENKTQKDKTPLEEFFHYLQSYEYHLGPEVYKKYDELLQKERTLYYSYEQVRSQVKQAIIENNSRNSL